MEGRRERCGAPNEGRRARVKPAAAFGDGPLPMEGRRGRDASSSIEGRRGLSMGPVGGRRGGAGGPPGVRTSSPSAEAAEPASARLVLSTASVTAGRYKCTRVALWKASCSFRGMSAAHSGTPSSWAGAAPLRAPEPTVRPGITERWATDMAPAPATPPPRDLGSSVRLKSSGKMELPCRAPCSTSWPLRAERSQVRRQAAVTMKSSMLSPTMTKPSSLFTVLMMPVSLGRTSELEGGVSNRRNRTGKMVASVCRATRKRVLSRRRAVPVRRKRCRKRSWTAAIGCGMMELMFSPRKSVRPKIETALEL
mmetsp:Transcript_18479/g.70032  ORF Transcript_18479/g.70032 Transcript_18479/m.70032 type:complete len:309 (+) Transcript_18479:283-1209(+)